MKESTFWNSYLSPNISPVFEERLCSCEVSFAIHRENISRLIDVIKPTTIAILGSGYLNDIPLADLLQNERKAYLIDWIDNVSKIGVSRKIICTTEKSSPNCLFCNQRSGEQYCKNYTGKLLSDGLCTGYIPTDNPFTTCKNYSPAIEPYFIKADITGGIARDFSESIESALPKCNTLKQAFTKAISISKKIKLTSIEIESDSIEFATSSMVISQFDVEPYTYFSTLLERKFGREDIIKYEKKLRPLMEQLRTNLFLTQTETHIKEIHRVVKKNCKPAVYLSTEVFRTYAGQSSSYLVQDSSKVIEIISQYFDFEFSDRYWVDPMKKTEIGDGESISQCYVLVPKQL